MSEASLEAWGCIFDQLPNKRGQVFRVLLKCLPNGATCREIAFALSWDRDSVSPRIGELKRLGLVFEAGTRGGETVWIAFPTIPKDKIGIIAKSPRRIRSFGTVAGFSQGYEDGKRRITVELSPKAIPPEVGEPCFVEFTATS